MTEIKKRYNEIKKQAAAVLPRTAQIPNEKLQRDLSIALYRVMADADLWPALEKAKFGLTSADLLEERLASLITEIEENGSAAQGGHAHIA